MLIIGWLFVGVGILGLFLPFLQGILFIMIGLAILSTRSEQIKRLLKRLEDRYPRHHDRVVVWREKIHKWFKKWTADSPSLNPRMELYRSRLMSLKLWTFKTLTLRQILQPSKCKDKKRGWKENQKERSEESDSGRIPIAAGRTIFHRIGPSCCFVVSSRA